MLNKVDPLPTFELLRGDFPILSTKVNNKPLVYFDNAASTQKPKIVIDAITNYYSSIYSNIHRGVHTLSQKGTDAYESTRTAIATFINAQLNAEIIFTKGTTDSINLLAHSLVKAVTKPGDSILITALEHHANLVPWQLACDNFGLTLKVVNMTPEGKWDLEDLRLKMADPTVKIAAAAWISNSLGTIHPIETFIQLAQKNNILTVVDAAQAVAHAKVDVQALDCDFLAFSAHKLYGPTGVGVLYGKQKWLEIMPPYQGGGDMINKVTFEKTTYNDLPFKFEAGTPNIADVIAFNTSLAYFNALDLEALTQHEATLLQYATARIKALDDIILYADHNHKAPILAFNVQGIHAYDIGVLLDKFGIAIRTGHHCTQPIMDYYEIAGTCRASFAFYNTIAEIDYFIEALEKSIQMLR